MVPGDNSGRSIDKSRAGGRGGWRAGGSWLLLFLEKLAHVRKAYKAWARPETVLKL